MYTYTAGATGLDAAMPPWVQDGGLEAWIARLKDPATRARVVDRDAHARQRLGEPVLLAGGPDKVLLVGFKNPKLKPLTGKTLAEVAQHARQVARGDRDGPGRSRTAAGSARVYFLMSEDNVQREIALPWVSFGSDAGVEAPEGVFLKSSTHPRAYGNFARLLGHYVRDEKADHAAGGDPRA